MLLWLNSNAVYLVPMQREAKEASFWQAFEFIMTYE